MAYLPKPQEHPTFKAMFTKQWIESLKKELIVFIDRLYPNTKISTIVTMYDKFIENNLDLSMERFESGALI